MKFEDNATPYLRLIRQGSTPGDAPSGSLRLFVDDADGLLKLIDESGTVVGVGGGASTLDDLTDVDLTTTAPSDGDTLIFDAGSGLWVPGASSGGGGGGSTYASYDDAIADLFPTGIVHRYEFEETSGTTLADSVGSLNLTLSGTFTLNVSSPAGKAVNFAGGVATASGSGSVPTGNNPRCFIALMRCTRTASNDADTMAVFSYGTPSTNYLWCTGFANANARSGSVRLGATLAVWGDDAVEQQMGQSLNGPAWHLAAWGYDGNKGQQVVVDTVANGHTMTSNAATATGTNFQIAKSNLGSGPSPLTGDMADFIVMDNWPGLGKIRQLFDGVKYLLT